MPILKENRARYPKNWQEIREERLKRAGYKCEWCGVKDGAVGFRDKEGKWWDWENVDQYDAMTPVAEQPEKPIKIVLTVAHLNHRPEDNQESNLRALCQRCHNRHDAKHRAETRRRRRNQNQLWLIAL